MEALTIYNRDYLFKIIFPEPIGVSSTQKLKSYTPPLSVLESNK